LEPDLKTYTSYLLLATFPLPWPAAGEKQQDQVGAQKTKYNMALDRNEASMWKRENMDPRHVRKVMGWD